MSGRRICQRTGERTSTLFPNLNKPDFEVTKLQWHELHDEAARYRLSNQIPVAQRGRDRAVFARQMAVVLLGIGILTVFLVLPWVADAPAAANGARPTAAMAEEPGGGVVLVLAPAPDAEP
ncbi:MAG: hypothetical protein M3509_12155 [Chloroflexota bacterium]|nr:hypothetical protein [Chloroflexota bacterium]